MNIMEIYNQYQVPAPLQKHMLKVAGIAKLIIDNWHGSIIDEDKIIKVLLLHDIGKIINIDLHPLKEQYLNIYGNDKFKISTAIAKNIGLKNEEIQLISQMSFLNNEQIKNCDDFNIKICAYANQRVNKDEIYSLYTRLVETKKNKTNNINYLIKYAREIEKQVLKYTMLEPEDINNETINIEELKKRII